MAAYPVDQGGKGSTIDVDPDAGIQKTAMADGVESGFTDFSGAKFRITIEHDLLGQADRDAIFAFFDAAPTAVHSVTTVFEGSYNCLFNNRPRLVKKRGNLASVVSVLTGVKAGSNLNVLGSGGTSFVVGTTVLGSNGQSFEI